MSFCGAANGQEGLAFVEKDSPDVVFLDIKMPGMDGLEVLGRIKATNETLPVVIMSGHATIETAVEATKKGAFDFIRKATLARPDRCDASATRSTKAASRMRTDRSSRRWKRGTRWSARARPCAR